MNKVARLLPEQYRDFVHRMEVIRLRSEIDCLSGRISIEERDAAAERTWQAAELVDRANTANFLPDDLLKDVDALTRLTYIGEDGQPCP